jgi:UDP-glucose 4-epimerase
MKVLITGGAGFIGSTVATALAKKNHEVIIYDIGTWDIRQDKIEYIKGDVFDVVHLTDVVRQCDGIIHMVGLPDARIAREHPQMSFELNVRSLQVLLEAAKNNSITRLILPSSAAIYGITERSPVTEETMPKLTSIYAYHKYIAERLAEAYSTNYNVHITVMRLFNVYGAQGAGILNILLENAMRGEPAKLYGEKQKRDFIHVSDVADAFVRVLELDHKFEVYNVGTGVGRSIQDMVNLVKEYLPNLTVTHGDYKGVLYDSVADITKLMNSTGFNPDGSDHKLREVIEKQVGK